MPVLPVVMGEEELGIGGFGLEGMFSFFFFFLYFFVFLFRSILRVGRWRREEGLPAAVCAICLVGRCGLVVADSVAYTDACCKSCQYGDDES